MQRLLVLVALVACAPLCAQQLDPKRVYPEFSVGITGIRATIEKGLAVTVAAVTADTPAAAVDLRVGDVLVSAGGRSLDIADPRVPLGEAIGAAEAGDGRLVLERRRGKTARRVTLKLARLGAYAEDWPRGCRKSAAIVAGNATFLVAAQEEGGGYRLGGRRPELRTIPACLAGLFLLSTGEAKYVDNVARQARALAALAEDRSNAGGHVNWQLGYQGILLAEYYLRTGDAEVLPGLRELCAWCVENQAAGGWSHNAPVGPGYVQSGLMNHAGLPILVTLILARECGIAVDEDAFARAMRLMDRMLGHGCVPYGDHRSELWWSNTNGRNAMLACALSLFADARYRQAAEHLATLVVDSYYQPEFGHTGGGFNVMWRGMGSSHVPASHLPNRRRQMRALAWYYDLCRLPGGGFAMPPTPPDNERYAGLAWGSGAVGLTYTAGRRTLRITGAPRTKFSREVAVGDYRWGNDADLVFLGTAHAAGFGAEDTAPHEVHALLLKDRKAEATVGFCEQHLRHQSPMVRSWAARRLGEIGSEAALDAIDLALRHDDVRVRRAGFDAISGYDNWSRPLRGKLDPAVVSARFLPAIRQAIDGPDTAWWEIDGALFALGCALPADIRAALPRVRAFAEHEDWYLREAAFWAVVGLHADISGEEFGLLVAAYRRSRHVFERSSLDAGFKQILKRDRVAFDRAVTAGAVQALGQTTHQPRVVLGYGTGGLHEAAHRTMMILKHFDPEVYRLMVDDFVAYLDLWEPHYQHSVWLITGSKWQPGILKVLEGLGAEGRPIVVRLRRLLERFPGYDRKRIGRAADELEQSLRAAVAAWESAHGKVR